MSKILNFEIMPMGEYAEKAYLDYSMYVVLDRALPFVGDVIGKYHLHGDYANYEAMVLMAKPSSSRVSNFLSF